VVVTSGSVMVLTVHDDRGKPLDRQAVVQMTNKANQRVLARVTQEDSTAQIVDLQEGVYDLSVSAFGYLTSHEDVTLDGRISTTKLWEISLKRDPSTVDLGAVKSNEMSPKVRKNMLHGLAAIKSSRLDDAQKKLDAAYKDDPSNPEVNFLLGYLYFVKKDMERAQNYLLNAVKLEPRNAQVLTLLGRVQIQRKDFTAARGPLEQAVAADPESWMAHYLLADVYLTEKEFEKSQQQASLAIERGKGAASVAQLILGQALADLRRYPEAVQALQAFLTAIPTDPNAPKVRELITEVEKRESQAPADAGGSQTMSSVVVSEPMVAAADPGLLVKNWGPAGIDDSKPLVAQDVSCPQGKVLHLAGERVKELVDDLAKFDAIEDVYHEDVDQQGIPKRNVTLRFDYVASISEPKPGRFLVDEFRSGRSGAEDFPDQIATRGLPTLAFIFHPDMRDDFDMSCEGLGTWNEKATWLVHFQQREDKPHRIQDYIINGRVYPVSMKGRAWISADTFQIVRLESELVTPMKEIELLSQHQTVDYAPVQFPKDKTELWLPKSAELYFDFRKHRYFRRHTFNHFMLFSVETQEKRKEPKQAGKGPESMSPKSKHQKKHA
jgi:tetratricopeptide (TPR) repeat protein